MAETSQAQTLEEQGLVLALLFGADGYVTDGPYVCWTWKSHSLTDARGRKSIESNALLPDSARNGLLAGPVVLHIDYDDGWLHGEISDTRHKHYTDAQEIGQFRFAFDATTLISARRHPLQSVDDVRRLVEQRKKAFRTPAELVESVVIHSLERLSVELMRIADDLDSIEDNIVGDAWHGERDRLGTVRRQLVFIHRQVAGVSGLFRHIEHVRHDDMPDAIADMVARLSHRSVALLQDSEQVQSRARLLQDELMARLSAESNRLLYVLSVMTAVLLPMTIISGLFGMNVGGLPLLESRGGFWIVTAVAFVVAAIVYVFVSRIGQRR